MYKLRVLGQSLINSYNKEQIIRAVDPFEVLESKKCHLLKGSYAHDNVIVDMVDEMGNTPYHAAASLGRSDAIQWLHGKKINVNELNNAGFTALHVACDMGYLHCVLALNMQGAQLDILTFPDGRTGVHLAARSGHWPIVNFLLKAGCSATVKDSNGLEPLDLAVSQGHDKVAMVLANFLEIPKPEVANIPDELRRQKPNNEETDKAELKKKREMFAEFHEKRRYDRTFLDTVLDSCKLENPDIYPEDFSLSSC